jgi:hypothetical protein
VTAGGRIRSGLQHFLSTLSPAAVAAMLGCAVFLALAMALASRPNAHPDEVFHVRAAEYYLSHWLYPRIGDPDTVASYSPYGYSYLARPDAAYFFAGLFGRIFSPLVTDPFIAFRLFNVSLLLAAGVLLVRTRDGWEALIGLLITPQVWYVFAYFNNDAFGLFLSAVLGCLVANPASGLSRFLRGESAPAAIAGMLVAGACAGLLLISKSNYFAALAFIGLYVAIRELGPTAATGLGIAAALLANEYLMPVFALSVEFKLAVWAVAALALGWPMSRLAFTRAGRAKLGRYGALVSVALMCSVPVLLYDRAINGDATRKGEAMKAIAAKTVAPELDPANEQAKGPVGGFQLRKRGIEYHEILFPPYNWPLVMVMSSVGVYGYMSISGPRLYYVAIWMVYLAFFAHIGSRLCAQGGAFLRSPDVWFLLFAALAAAGLTAATSYQAWALDYQAQGRYLFPLLPILGILVARYRTWLHPAAIPAFVHASFALSALSFVFVGLWRIPKVF